MARKRPRAAKPGRAADDHGAWGPRVVADLTFLEHGIVATPQAPAHHSSPITPLHDARDEFEKIHPARAGRAAGEHVAHCEVLGVERSNLYAGRCAPSASCRRGEEARMRRPSRIGLWTTIPRRALIVDVAALDRNIARMAAFFASGAADFAPLQGAQNARLPAGSWRRDRASGLPARRCRRRRSSPNSVTMC